MYQLTPYERKMLNKAYRTIAVLILIGTVLLSCDAIENFLKP
jgi:hypothetical protein